LQEGTRRKIELRSAERAVALQAVQLKEGVVRVSVFVTVDVNPLQFATNHGRHMQQLVLLK
jgi:predicted DNA-binding antitoxin AbrB/MazE fold protein